MYLHHPLYTLGLIYLLILVLRAVLSWFPIQPGTALATVNHWLSVVTEPVLAPFRKVIPPLVFSTSPTWWPCWSSGS